MARRSSLPASPVRRTLLLAAGTLPLAACGTLGGSGFPPGAAPAQAPGAPRMNLGDTWRYLERNRYNGLPLGELVCEVVAVSPQVRVRWSDARGVRGEEVHAQPGLVVQDPAYDAPVAFETPQPWLPDPVAAGGRFATRTHYRAVAGSDRLFWHLDARATGWERVRVPAGEFDALRIERWIFFQHPDYFRLDNRRWDHLWYAPAVDRWVLREWSGSYRWPGSRRGGVLREDWIVRELLEMRRAG